jgi:hypothetical protein
MVKRDNTLILIGGKIGKGGKRIGEGRKGKDRKCRTAGKYFSC